MKDAAPQPLQIETRRTPEGLMLLFSGSLIETSSLDVRPEGLDGTVTLDLHQVRRINSAGAQMWTKWVARFGPESKLRFERMPTTFAELASVVDAMIPPGSSIDSFFVPYFDASRDEIENVLFVRDQHFNESELRLPPLLRSPMTDEPLEIDVSPGKYFRFLRRVYPKISL